VNKKAELAERRELVAANLLAGVKYRQMAKKFDVSLGTIANDVKQILKAWHTETNRDTEEWATLEAARLDSMLQSIWKEVMDGNTQYMDRALRIMERRARLLGLDKPIQTDITSAGERVGITYITENRDNGDDD
jgi:hypothetical protein